MLANVCLPYCLSYSRIFLALLFRVAYFLWLCSRLFYYCVDTYKNLTYFSAISSLKQQVEGLEDLNLSVEILVRLLCIIPGWSEKNVQVLLYLWYFNFLLFILFDVGYYIFMRSS